ncbi:inner membrane component of ABC transporter, partial [Streptococcus pneumoniae 845]
DSLSMVPYIVPGTVLGIAFISLVYLEVDFL